MAEIPQNIRDAYTAAAAAFGAAKITADLATQQMRDAEIVTRKAEDALRRAAVRAQMSAKQLTADNAKDAAVLAALSSGNPSTIMAFLAANPMSADEQSERVARAQAAQ